MKIRTLCILTGFLALLFVAKTNSFAQPTMVWAKQYGSEKGEYVMNHCIDRESNIYVSGKTTGVIDKENFGKLDGFISKIDSSGKVIWSRQFGTAEDEDVLWSAIDSKGFMYITGSSKGSLSSPNKGKEDIILLKYSPEGKQIWTRQFGTDSADVATGIFIDKNGNIYLSGFTSGKFGETLYGNQDGFLMKVNPDGNPDFIYQVGTTEFDACTAITGDNNGMIYLTGTTFGKLGSASAGMIDGILCMFTENGKLQKSIQFGSEGFDITTSIQTDSEKNIYIGGSTSGDFADQQNGEGDCFIAKFNTDGNLVWKDQFGTPKHDGIKSIYILPGNSGEVIASGLLSLPPANSFIRKYDRNGGLLWENKLVPDGSSNDASGKSALPDSFGNMYQVGLTSSSLLNELIGEQDFFVVKFKL